MPITHETPYRRPRKRRHTFEQRVFLVDRMFSKLKAFDCRYTRLLGNMNADFGLTRARLRILDIVVQIPGLNISGIAYFLDLSRQSVHRTIRAMEAAGLLELERVGKKALVPRLATTGRIVAKLRLTQAHEWSQQLSWGIPTEAASTAGWIAQQLIDNLPQRLITDEVDPHNLPTGMPRGVEWAIKKRPHDPRWIPKHPIIKFGDPLWPNDKKPSRLIRSAGLSRAERFRRAGAHGYAARAADAR